MIDARELRLGNVYNRKHGKGWTETVITEDLISKIFNGNPQDPALDDFEPIPLSEDWLLRFTQFQKTANDIFHAALFPGLELVIGKLPTHKQFILYELHHKVDDELLATITLNPLEFVHTLQNTFYALTGTELTQLK